MRAAVASWWAGEYADYELRPYNSWLTRLLASPRARADRTEPLAIGDAWGAWRRCMGFLHGAERPLELAWHAKRTAAVAHACGACAMTRPTLWPRGSGLALS